MQDTIIIKGIECRECDGMAYVRLDAAARGLGFTLDKSAGGDIDREYLDQCLESIGFPRKDAGDGFIPENAFCKLAMKAPRTPDTEKFQAMVVDEVIPAVRRCYGVRPMPGPSESVKAACVLLRARGADRHSVLKLLKQGGFDVDKIEAPRDARPAEPSRAASPAPAGPGVPADGAGSPSTAYEDLDGYLPEFLKDVLPRAHWDMLPFSYLLDLYNGWLRANHPGAEPCRRNPFVEALGRHVEDYGWSMPERNKYGQYKKTWSQGSMCGPEPMIVEYRMTAWYNPDYDGDDLEMLAMPKLAAAYPGIHRVKN